jgi:hypothetical protein
MFHSFLSLPLGWAYLYLSCLALLHGLTRLGPQVRPRLSSIKDWRLVLLREVLGVLGVLGSLLFFSFEMFFVLQF